MSGSVSPRGAASSGEQAVTAQRCAAQLLCGEPAASTEEVARRLLAVQAQDPRGARLAVRARSAGLSAADVDAALASRSLIVSWLNRGTLHLVRAEYYWWLHPLTTPQLRTGTARRLEQEGVSPQDAERGVSVIAAALAADADADDVTRFLGGSSLPADPRGAAGPGMSPPAMAATGGLNVVGSSYGGGCEPY